MPIVFCYMACITICIAEASFFIVALGLPQTITACPAAPLVVTDASPGLLGKKPFLKNMTKVYHLLFSLFSMLKDASMFKNAASPLGYHLKIFQA